MTVATETRRAGPYSGNGSTQVFAFAFKCYAAADLVVVTTTSGVDTVKTLTTHYTVSLNSNQNTSPGGSITMLTAPASGTTLVITSDQSYLQELSLVNAGAWLPEALNDAFDKQTIFHQQNRYDIDRSVRGAISDATMNRLPAASVRADGLLGFDADGQPEIVDIGSVEGMIADIATVAGIATEIEIVAAADVDIGAVAENIGAIEDVADWLSGGAAPSPIVVADYTALKALTAGQLASYGSVIVQGARGGVFEIKTASAGTVTALLATDPGEGVYVSLTNGGGTIYAERRYTGPLEAAWWGVVADATVSAEAWTGTDNTTALNNAVAYLRRKLTTDTTEGTNSLSFPTGFILVTSANFTSLRGTNWALYGNGCALVSKTAGKVVADFLHSWKGAIYDMAFIGDINTPPRRGVQQGYITSAAVSASTLHFINCYSVGYFSDCALYNGGSEEAKYNGPIQWENRQSTCTASGILDAYNEDGRFSDYQTGDLVAKAITGVTQANPGVVTCANHGYTNGQIVKFSGVGGMTQLNGNVYTVANATTNSFELSGTDTSGFGAYTSGGFVWRLVAYSFVNVNMVQASFFSQLGGNALVIRGGVQNVYFDGYTYSLDKAGLLVDASRNTVDTRRANDLTFMAVIEGTNLKSCIEVLRGGTEVVFTGWKISLNGIQPDDQIFLDDNTSGQIYLSGARIEIDTISTTPTNGIFFPTTKWAGQGELFLRPATGLTGLPDFWNGRMEVVDGAEWGFPAGSYDIEMIKLTAAETTTLYRKGETRFVSTAAGTIADAGLAALGFTSVNGSRVLSPFIGTEVSFTMADDTAKIIDLPGSTPAVIIAIACSSGSFANGLYWTRASGSPASVALTSGGTPATLSTGIKTGTTGADGVFHFSPHTDGNLYLENRSGSSLVVSYTILSAV